MSYKIKLKSDQFNDPEKAALDLQSSQLDRIAIRDGVDKFLQAFDLKIDQINKDIVNVEEILGLAANKDDLDSLESSFELSQESIKNLDIALTSLRSDLGLLKKAVNFNDSDLESSIKSLEKDMIERFIKINKEISSLEIITGSLPTSFFGRLSWIIFGPKKK